MTQNERLTAAELAHLRKLVPESKDYPRPELTRMGRTIEAMVWLGPLGALVSLIGIVYIWWNR